jgi:beta-lactamase regulating signal transducer with metallopeptidase domain
MADSILPSLILRPEAAVAWAATFILHSTLLIGSIWLLTRMLGMKAMAVQDKLWKVALIGALFSCTVQAGLGDGAIAPRFSLTRVPGPPVAAVPGPGPAVITADHADPRVFSSSGQTAGSPAMPAVREQIHRLLPVRWQRLLFLLWGLGAAGFTGGLVLQLLSLRSRFQGRRELTSGPLHHIFKELVASRPVGGLAIKLTVSDRIPVPVACGIRRPEVCLPGSMVRDSAPEQLRSVLAHELAHIVRRDQAWLLAARLAEGIFFFQPLVRLARRCYQETAEFICDDEAVRQTGERVPLARSLHEMARKRVSTPTALTIPGISGKGSPLNRRIEMILDKNRPAAANGRARWFGPLAVVLVLVFAVLAPGVTASDAPPRPEEVPSVEALPAPDAPAPARQVAVPPAERVPAPEATLDAPAPPATPAIVNDEELSEAEAAELAEMEREMEVHAEEMKEMEREMELEAVEMAEMEREMELEAVEMAEMEREIEAEAAEMAEVEREMELMEQELARAEDELLEEEETLIREEEALIEQLREDEEAGKGGDATGEEVRVRKEEIRRQHAEIRERHRQISREHHEISRRHRDAARRQVEALRQRRAVVHSEESALRAQRRGLTQAMREIDRSLDGELTDEQRERLTAIKLDMEEKLRDLEESGAVEQVVMGEGSVPRPEELE